MTGTYAETFPHNTSCSHALSPLHRSTTIGLPRRRGWGLRRNPASLRLVRLDPPRSWREDRLDLISDRSGGGGVPSMQDGGGLEGGAHCADATPADPPDNIPFWKSDFSAVLAIFGAPLPRSFLRSILLIPLLPPVRTFVLYLTQLCAVIQVILLIPRRLPAMPCSPSLPPLL